MSQQTESSMYRWLKVPKNGDFFITYYGMEPNGTDIVSLFLLYMLPLWIPFCFAGVLKFGFFYGIHNHLLSISIKGPQCWTIVIFNRKNCIKKQKIALKNFGVWVIQGKTKLKPWYSHRNSKAVWYHPICVLCSPRTATFQSRKIHFSKEH